MACNRCERCDINFPLAWGTCAACGNNLEQNNIENPDPNYREKVAPAKRRFTERTELEELFPVVIGEVKDDMVQAVDVVRSGISHELPPDTLIRVRNRHTGEEKFYEVGAYSYELRGYWVLPFDPLTPDTVPEEWQHGD